MNIFNVAVLRIGSLMGAGKSTSSFGLIIKSYFMDLFTRLSNLFVRLMYAIAKFMLNIIDFFEVFIKELAGQNQTINKRMSASDLVNSDLVFKFLFDDSQVFRNVIRGAIGLAVVLVIVFSLIGMLKTEYESAANAAESNSKKQVLRHALQSLFMIVLVPFIALGGILLSNSVLRSIGNATSQVSGEVSLGGEIFVASTYQANAYRKYAMDGKAIPITYNFEKEVAENFKFPTGTVEYMSDSMSSFNELSAWEKGVGVWQMFYTDSFNKYDELNTDEAKKEAYYTIYDENLRSNQAEYYAMSDVVDYMVRSGSRYHMMSLNELASIYGVNYEGSTVAVNTIPTSPKGAYKQATNGENSIYNARIIDNASGEDEWEYYVTVEYSPFATANVTGIINTGIVDYTFTPTNDEAKGAKFVLCTYEQVEGEYEYIPLTNSATSYGNNLYHFHTDYLNEGSLIIAKGVFSEDGYPTAIRKVENRLEFYRDNVSIPVLADFFPVISYEMPPDENESFSSKAFKGSFKAITGVDISELIPYVYFRTNAWSLFTKTELVEASFNNDMFYVNYNFSGNMEVQNVYHLTDINLFVMYFAAVLILQILGTALFGLVGRTYNLILLFISYPVFASTMPIDQGSRFKQWTSEFIKQLLSTYGLIIGLNMVFLLLPTINELKFFTQDSFPSNLVMFSWLPTNIMVATMNMFVRIMFTLVAFVFIKTAISTISTLLGSENILNDGQQVLSDVSNAVRKTAAVVSGKIIVDKAKDVAKDAVNMTPGSAAVASLIQRRKDKQESNKAKDDLAARRKIMHSGEKDKIVQKQKADEKKAEEAKAKKKKEESEKKRREIMFGKEE